MRVSILFYREKKQKFTNMFQRLRQDIVFKWLLSGQCPHFNSTFELYRKWFDVALASIWLQRVYNLPVAFVWFNFFMWIFTMSCHDLPSMIYGLLLSDNTSISLTTTFDSVNNLSLNFISKCQYFLSLELSSWFHKFFSQGFYFYSLYWWLLLGFHF
jgi:hypothetical protein